MYYLLLTVIFTYLLYLFYFRLETSEMDDLLECKICFRIYNEVKTPIIFPCGHTFCSTCVQALSPEEGFCPTCRKDISTAFQQLPVNYALLELALAVGKNNSTASSSDEVRKPDNPEIFCKNHKEQPIRFFCKIYEEWLCKECIKNHMHEESSELSKCFENTAVALPSLKAKVQKHHTEKLNEIQTLIEEIECILTTTNVLSYKLKKISCAKNSLQEKNDILGEHLKELKTKGLRHQFKLTELNLKLNEVDNVSGWIENEKNLKKMDDISEINCDFQEIQQKKNDVSLNQF